MLSGAEFGNSELPAWAQKGNFAVPEQEAQEPSRRRRFRTAAARASEESPARAQSPKSSAPDSRRATAGAALLGSGRRGEEPCSLLDLEGRHLPLLVELVVQGAHDARRQRREVLLRVHGGGESEGCSRAKRRLREMLLGGRHLGPAHVTPRRFLTPPASRTPTEEDRARLLSPAGGAAAAIAWHVQIPIPRPCESGAAVCVLLFLFSWAALQQGHRGPCPAQPCSC